SLDHPVRSINFVAGPYVVQSKKVSSVTLYSYFFKEDNELAAGYLDKAEDYIKRYEALIGPFPYQRYSIVENRLPTGYGMPTFTLLGQAVVRLPFIKDSSLGHEILHSWFGNCIQVDYTTGNWCEGLTTYMADQSYAADIGEDVSYRKNQMLRYASYVPTDNTMPLTDFGNAGDSQPMAKKIRAIGYDKAGMLFHMLKNEVGEDFFNTSLRTFYSRFQHKRAGWKDIETIFSEVAGRDLKPFFSQWLNQTDIPQLSVQQVSVEQKDGMSMVAFHLVQDNETPYLLKVPVVVESLTDTVRKTVEMDSSDQEFEIAVKGLPTKLIIDPGYDLMRGLAAKETPAIWSQLMGAEQKNIVLSPDTDRTAYEPFISYLEQLGAKSITADNLKNSELAETSYIFLGRSAPSLSLFADPRHPKNGFTLDVRTNPLNQEHNIGLVTSNSLEETQKTLRKLRHYGKYSYLHFEEGKIREKRIAPTENGMTMSLITTPQGIPTEQVQSFEQIVEDLSKSRVIYVGETHTNYAAHLLQLQIIQTLHLRDPNLAIGMEMYPRSSQQALDDYINGAIDTEEEFIKASRYFQVWGYDYRMYRDIFGYAKKHAIPLVGLNLEKKIVSTVFKSGNTDELTEEQNASIASERNLDMPGYSDRLGIVHSQHRNSPNGNGFVGFIQAQAMWDETMAESITNYLKAHPEKRMVIIAGTGHVYKDSAIPPRVARRLEVRQSVVVVDNGMESGREQGKQADYLMFTTPVELEPAGKIGVVLNVEEPKGDEDAAIVRIIKISSHGKAGEAGIKEKDIVLAVDGHKVSNVADLKIGLLNKSPGDRVTLQIFRKRNLLPDKTLELEVELSNMSMSGMMMPPGHPKK
ncbi:MAG: PDZ domain-containing protein, partial [Desulfobulbaceae bacterium]|nr:PDZ domain-containing protein [Desulfobulbaceae bacterium]